MSYTWDRPYGGGQRGMRTLALAVAMTGSMVLSVTPVRAQSGRATLSASLPPVLPQAAAENGPVPGRVSVTIKDRTIEYVILEIARQAKIHPVYDNTTPLLRKRISVKLTNVDVMQAFATVLKGTRLEARLASDGTTVMVGVADTSGARTQGDVEHGTVVGRVTDSTGAGIPGVVVLLAGTKNSAVTDSQGRFVLRNVPTGEQRITAKRFGYYPAWQSVTVVDGQTVTVQLRLVSAPTELSGVVTTATGIQRRIEVGNDITTIAVDSVLKAMPVSTLTDLLATRVPGLTVAPTSGAPGAPSRVRIRGISSINATNDPIVILDGIRMYAAQTPLGKDINGAPVGDRTKNLAASGTSNPLVPSPLDQIDPNSLETVEVLKGPSAVALYGSDAANGVIVLTTKRGVAGATQVGVSGAVGTQFIAGQWPTNYYMWGHNLNDPDQLPVQCSLGGPQSIGSPCAYDSLVTYQILNNPSTTPFGHGQMQSYRADVRGGMPRLRYAFTGSAANTLGLIKLPDVDVAVLQNLGRAVPNWQRRPQADETQSGSARIDVDVGPQATVGFTSLLDRKFTRTTPLDQAIQIATILPPPTQASGGSAPSTPTTSGLLQGIPDFATKNSTQTIRTTNAVSASARTARNLDVNATAGLDFTSRRDLSTLGRGQCFDGVGSLPGTLNCSGNLGNGFFNTANGTAIETSLNVGLSLPITFGRLLSLRTSVGGNYNKSSTDDMISQASDIPTGATSGNEAALHFSSEANDDRNTVGVFVETVIGVADRLFIPLAFRVDAGSALGTNVTPAFPKLSLSYLVSDEPKFRALPLLGRLNTLRLRMAYGRAGVQPDVTSVLRTYGQQSTTLDGTYVSLASIGNTQVRPERTTELEGGFDADLWRNRINLGVTWYRKHTVDALVREMLPPSLGLTVTGAGTGNWFYGTPSWQANIGVVDNTGIETTFGATILESRATAWSVNLGLSRTRNRLARRTRSMVDDGGTIPVSAVGQAAGSVFSRFVDGYPLYGYWAYPVAGYSDVDGDGVIERGEVQIGDSAVYLGAPYPNYTASIHNTVTLFSRVTVGATFSYQNGLTQVNGLLAKSLPYSQVFNDTSSSQASQAYLFAALFPTNGRPGSAIGYVQTVSMLRFDALSVGWVLPAQLTRAMLRGRNLHVAIQGTNLGSWSNYRGKDPSVSGSMSELVRDFGVLPTPRAWQLSFRID